MKKLNHLIPATLLLILFTGCQQKADMSRLLAQPDTRNEILNAIARDSSLSNAMIDTLMANPDRHMAMQHMGMQRMMMQHNGSMANMMRSDTAMMHQMMMTMMESANTDTAMMRRMCSDMMANKPMMNMMEKMKKMDSKNMKQ